MFSFLFLDTQSIKYVCQMRVLATIFIITILSCSSSTENLPAGLQYYPDIELLKEGIVFKYYYHQGKKVAQPKTDIVYRKMVLKDNIFINEDYNAAFEKTYFYEIKIEGSKWKSIAEKSIDYRSVHKEMSREYNYTLMDNVHTDWEENDALLEKKIMDGENGNRIERTQSEIRDSVNEGRKIKVIKGKQTFYPIRGGEENEPFEYDMLRQYEEGLGMTKSVVSNKDYEYKMELDEIMTLKEFEKRAGHGTHRVGYIDTLLTLDDHTLFDPCFHPAKINDYYNDQRAEFIGGKGRLRSILKENLDSEKLGGESGYLTYRFVVNCNGEAGWFVTEEAGLDYEKKQFSEDCRLYLYEILKAEKEWKNLVIGTEPRDAYTYITFKIKNGDIIELLP